MGKWWMPDNGTAAVGIHDEDGKWLSDAAYRSHADAIIAAHNADCAAYENQIADLEEERDAAVEFAHTVEREFAAANATLERLREVVREYDDQWQDCEPGDLQRLASSVHAILYPQMSKT